MKKYSVFQIVRFKNYIAVHLSVFVFANFTIPNHLWLRFRFVNRAAYDNILSALKYYGSTNLCISLVLMCINTQTSVQHACLMAKTIQFPPFNTPQIHLDFIAVGTSCWVTICYKANGILHIHTFTNAKSPHSNLRLSTTYTQTRLWISKHTFPNGQAGSLAIDLFLILVYKYRFLKRKCGMP